MIAIVKVFQCNFHFVKCQTLLAHSSSHFVGVAAVLEVARALHDANCTNEFTVILVAFDLEENGGEGSRQFVQDFLLPRLLTSDYGLSKSKFAGAIILDCVLGYNDQENSQVQSWNL